MLRLARPDLWGPGMRAAHLHCGPRAEQGESAKGNAVSLLGGGNEDGRTAKPGFSPQAQLPVASSLGRAALLLPSRMRQEAQRVQGDCNLDFDRLLVARGPAHILPASFGPLVPFVCPFFSPQGHGTRTSGVTSSATSPLPPGPCPPWRTG